MGAGREGELVRDREGGKGNRSRQLGQIDLVQIARGERAAVAMLEVTGLTRVALF